MVPGLDQSMLLRVCDLKHSTTLLRGIQHESYMDIMFICRGNVKVFAQKLVLLSVSPFMKLLLSHVSCCPHNIFCVSLPDISPVALQLVLDFLYEGVMKVRESELQDFSDAMFVLGIEVPPTATALKMELLDVPEVPLQRSQMPPPPPLVGSHLDLGEPVDPLNIPDYYHDQNMMPRVALPVSVAPSTSNSVSAMNANIVEQKPVTRSAVDARTQVSTLENPSTGRPNSNIQQLAENTYSRKKNGRTSLSEENAKFLEYEFLKNPSPSAKYKKILAKRLKLNEKVIKNWFTTTRKKIRAKKQYVLGAVPQIDIAPTVSVKEEVPSFGSVG